MANIRHTIVVRKDLNMPTGLLMAQACHISDAFLRDRAKLEEKFTELEKDWMRDPYISVLSVDNLEELEEIEKDARGADLQVYVWRDIIPSTNLNRPIPNVKIGISIGPADFDAIKAVTGTLPLF